MTEQDLQQIKLHFRKYRDAYIVFGAGVVAGFAFRGIVQGKPKIDERAIIAKWLTALANDGYYVYGLTTEQKKLWDSVWRYAEANADRLGWSVSKVVEQMTKDYGNVLGYGPNIPAGV